MKKIKKIFLSTILLVTILIPTKIFALEFEEVKNAETLTNAIEAGKNVILTDNISNINKTILINKEITVDLNGKGEVLQVFYNIREYESKEKVDLISIKEAIENIKKDDAFIEVESVSDKLIFKNVHLSYWTQNRNKDNLIMQPVYVFSGTSITSDGSEEPFSITVQANEV